jgi:hypothetical protein
MATFNLAVGKQLDLRKSGYRTGRGKEAWPPMPKFDNRRIDRVATWMQAHRENRRPLTVAAPLLSLVCALHEDGHHLPTRARLAEAIGCTKDGVDAAISTAIAYGEISERHVTLDGAVAKRRSTRRLRFIDPSPELLAAWNGESASRQASALDAKASPGGNLGKPVRSPWPGVLATPELPA